MFLLPTSTTARYPAAGTLPVRLSLTGPACLDGPIMHHGCYLACLGRALVTVIDSSRGVNHFTGLPASSLYVLVFIYLLDLGLSDAYYVPR